MALGILQGFPRLDASPESAHRAIEALKLAYADGKRYIAERRDMDVRAESLLEPAYLARRGAQIGAKALYPEPGDPDCGGTVYFCTADGEGNMVSWIQSNYKNFGSGVVIPGTGIALHDRGLQLQPGTRPRPTASRRGGGRTIPSSPASSQRTARPSAPSGSWARLCSRRGICR